MPSKRKNKTKTRKYNIKGAGFFGDVWKGVKKGVSSGYNGLSKINDYARKYKIASAGLSLASIFQPELAPLAGVAAASGYGKNKRKRNKK